MTRNQKIVGEFIGTQQEHNKVALETDRELLTGQKKHNEVIRQVVLALNGISAKMDEKEKLKEKFRYILENYIRTRDGFGMMTSSKEKDELVRNTKNQIDLL